MPEHSPRILRYFLLLAFLTLACASDGGIRSSGVEEEHIRYLPFIAQTPPVFYTTGSNFRAQPLALDDAHLFDVGIADINGDHALDIYTTNHSARQSFLENNGTGAFPENKLTVYGFDHSPQFPGLEDSLDFPDFAEPGLYIFWHDSTLILSAYDWSGLTSISASAVFIPEIQVAATGAIDFELTYDPLPTGDLQTVVNFEVTGDGVMQITPLPKPSVGSPINFDVDEAANLDNLFIGISKTNPSVHSFLLHLKDRHGMAWADYNRDGLPDAYMSRGGNRGDSELYPLELIIDEFYVSNGGTYDQIPTDSLGFVKNGCAARQVAWTEINGDDLVDLYIVCARGDPNQLYLKHEDGTFHNAAEEYGVGLRDDGDFVFLDIDSDGDQDLFWAGTQSYILLLNQGATFSREELAIPDGRATKLSVGDFDADGDADIFAASSQQSLLFQNNGGVLTPTIPGAVGLPSTAHTANWVDYDNDGLLDLHVVPHGLYRQRPGLTFVNTGLLKLESGAAVPVEARASWFDADGDGWRDLIVSTYLAETDQDGQTQSQWFTAFYRNQTPATHNWLAVDLEGVAGNGEAIGAAVVVEFDGQTRVQQVGWSDGARFSAGHYRLYFGLGDAANIDRVTVSWPDGSEEIVQNVVPNQLLVIPHTP